MEKPRLSVVIPVCNDLLIGNCLHSVQSSQGYEDTEVLLVQNGVSQEVRSLTGAYAATDERITILSTEVKGCSSSRNLGIEASQGDYILTLDSDVEISRMFLSAILSLIDQEPDVEVIVPLLLRLEGSTWIQKRTSSHFTRLNKRAKRPVHNPGLVVKKNVYQEIGLLDERFRHGNDNDLKRNLRGRRTLCTNKAAVFHTADDDGKVLRQHYRYGAEKSNISRTSHPENRDEIVAESVRRILLFPKFVDSLPSGVQNAAYEALISLSAGVGFFVNELKFTKHREH